MIQEVEQIDKNIRKETIKKRMFFFLLAICLLLFGYLIYEIVAIVNNLIA